jgi:hypothetical protein
MGKLDILVLSQKNDLSVSGRLTNYTKTDVHFKTITNGHIVKKNSKKFRYKEGLRNLIEGLRNLIERWIG